MKGVIIKFSLDLLAIPCFIPGKGDGAPITLETNLYETPATITLKSENSSAITRGDGSGTFFFYNKIEISIRLDEEETSNASIQQGRARYLIMSCHPKIIDAINRLIIFFKYKKHHPNLRPISIYELLPQQVELYNPSWESIDGVPISVGDNAFESGIHTMEGMAYLQDNFFGITPITSQAKDEIQEYCFSPNIDISLSAELLSDAQGAALEGNTRRAILELAISIEIFVKSAFFKQEKIAGSAFEYLEDKGKETIKVPELLDGAAIYAFGESFKKASKDSYQHISHIFRCRNKIAHRGEATYRDDSGNWIAPDRNELQSWWAATLEMFNWLQRKIDDSRAQQ